MTKQTKAILVAGFALAVGALSCVLALMLMGPEEATVASGSDFAPLEVDDAATAVSDPQPLTAEQVLQQRFEKAASVEDRLAALDHYAAESDATSGSNALRARMIVDDSPRVRLRAFQVAKKLAEGEGRDALISVLKAGVGNPYAEVRRESIRTCRDNPNYELMDDLLEVVDRGGDDRSVAIQALAYMDDHEAQRKVLETAQSDALPRADRIQAIVLLCRTNLDEGVSYLQELATGEDPELQRYAMEALKAWQDRKAGR